MEIPFSYNHFKELLEQWPNTMQDPVAKLILGSYVVAGMSIFTLVAIFVTVLWLRIRNYFLSRQKNRLAKHYSSMLAQLVFDEEDLGFIEHRSRLIRHIKRNYFFLGFNKRVFRQQILHLHDNVIGFYRDVLEGFYRELQLYKQAIKDLKGTDWHLKAQAIRELSQMRYVEAAPLIMKYTKHENRRVRTESFLALILLAPKPFQFLGSIKQELTIWQQMHLEEYAYKLKLEDVPKFEQWYHSPNQSVVQFCLKVTAAFNQVDSGKKIVELLHTTNQKTLIQAIRTLGYMMEVEAVQPFIELYPNAAPQVQKFILIGLGEIGGQQAVSYLESVLLEGKYPNSFIAAESLFKMGPEGSDSLNRALTVGDPETVRMVKHFLDERIHHA